MSPELLDAQRHTEDQQEPMRFIPKAAAVFIGAVLATNVVVYGSDLVQGAAKLLEHL